jgi:nicotinamidase-related amidase
MAEKEAVIKASSTLIKGCRLMNVPIFFTEQYPEGLGPTESELLELLGDSRGMTKKYFSCCRDTNLVEELKSTGISQVVLAGMETHVCVLQTALDLITDNFQVFLARDAVTSRKTMDRDVALERMRQHGIIITTVESILFELLESANAPEFQKVQRLIK